MRKIVEELFPTHDPKIQKPISHGRRKKIKNPKATNGILN